METCLDLGYKETLKQCSFVKLIIFIPFISYLVCFYVLKLSPVYIVFFLVDVMHPVEVLVALL